MVHGGCFGQNCPNCQNTKPDNQALLPNLSITPSDPWSAKSLYVFGTKVVYQNIWKAARNPDFMTGWLGRWQEFLYLQLRGAFKPLYMRLDAPKFLWLSSSKWKERDRMCLRFLLEVEYLPPIVILSNHQSHSDWCNLYLYFNLYFYRASELSQIQKQVDVAMNDHPLR